MARLVDGIGWGCSIHDYVQDRYSRYLVNKALEHNLDVSKKGALVDELTSRLSGTSTLRPTKSDLATFAKREGIDVKSDDGSNADSIFVQCSSMLCNVRNGR